MELPLHPDILPKSQQEVWGDLKQIPSHFVLYGGTALALRFGHRISVDFDLFSSSAFDPLILRETLPLLKDSVITQQGKNTLAVLAGRADNPVKLSFFGGLPFGTVAAPHRCKDNGLLVASPLDVGVQKLRTVIDRDEAKDFLDLEVILRNGYDVENLLGAAQCIYPGFSAAVALKTMAYFSDVVKPQLSKKSRVFLSEVATNAGAPVPMSLRSVTLDALPEAGIPGNAKRP